MLSTNARLNNNNYFIYICYFVFTLLLSISCSSAMAASFSGYIKVTGYVSQTSTDIKYNILDEDTGKTYTAEIPKQYLIDGKVNVRSAVWAGNFQTFVYTVNHPGQADFAEGIYISRVGIPDSNFNTYTDGVFFKIEDIQDYLPPLKIYIKTYDPVDCVKNKIHNRIDIGITDNNSTPQDLYATGSNPAVLIIKSGLSPLPTIDKINIKGNVYGALRSTSSTFNSHAVAINNTNNMPIKNGIEIDSGCTIKGHSAIHIKGDLTTNIINHGTVCGTRYSFYDKKKSAAHYEIHNQANATIDGYLYVAALRIENSGIIKGLICINGSHTTIKNNHSGKMQNSNIYSVRNGHITLNNSGEITVTEINIDRNFTNYGTIEQTDLSKDFILGDKNDHSSYSATNYGNITAGNFTTYGKLTNKSTGNMQLNKGLSFESEVENHGTINVTGKDWMHFCDKVTNSGNITSPYGFTFDKNLDNSTTGKISLGHSQGYNSINGNVNNHGSLYFTSHVDYVLITNYHGYTNSELVLTLPSLAPTTPLLTVTGNANFDVGAKIILAANQNVANYLATSKRITILKANSNLTGTGINKPEDLLFTRVYDASYKTTTTINASSILFSIENITANNKTISANLTLKSISALGLQATTVQSKLIDSLLKNKIIAASQTYKPKPKPIKTVDPVDRVKYTSSIIDIGITDNNPTPEDLYAKGSDPAVLIIKPNLSPLPTIDRINIKGNVYGALRSTPSTFDRTAIEIKNTNNMTIKDGIHISNNSTIRGDYGMYITDSITTNIINDGTISGSGHGIKCSRATLLNGTLTNQGVISGETAIFVYQRTSSGKKLVIENSKIGLIKGIVDCYDHSGAILVNHGMIDSNLVGINITNTGSITNSLNKGLSIVGALTNTGTIIADKHDSADNKSLTFSENVYNSGYIKSLYTTELALGQTLTNEGTFTTAALVAGGAYIKNIFLHNQTTNAVAEFTASFNEPYLHINNQGSLSLQASSTIGNYTSNDGNLIINIDDGLQTNKNLLFISESSFTKNSKILINVKFTNIKNLVIPNLEILHGEKLVCDGNLIYPSNPSHLHLFKDMITIKTIGKGISTLSNYKIQAGSIIITADFYYRNKQFLNNMQNSKQQLFTKNKTIVDAISFNINKNNIAISPAELVLGQQLIKVKNKNLTIESNLPVAIPKVIIGTSVYQQNNSLPISQATVELNKIIIANITIAARSDAIMINGSNKLILTDSKGLVVANNTKITANETALNIIPSFKGNITNHGVIGNKQTTTALQLATVNGIIINYATIEANTNAIKLTSKQSKLKIINHGQLIGDVIADKTTMVTIKNYNNIIASKITNIKHLTNSGKITITANNKLQNYLGLKHAELIINIDNCFYNNNWKLPESLLYINKANFAAESYLTINANKYANKLSESPKQLTLLIAASLTIAGKNADQLINDNKNLLALTSKSILIKINNPQLILINNNYQLTAAISRAETTSNNPLAKQLQTQTNNLIKNTHKQQPVTRLKEQCLENNNQASCAISHRLALARAKQAVFIYGNQQQTTGINAGDVAGTNYQLWSSFNYQHKNYHQQADIKSGRGNSKSYNFGIDSTNNKLGCGLMYSYSKTTTNIKSNTQQETQQADYQALALYNDYKFSPFNLQTAILASKTKYHVNKNKYDDYTYSVLIELVYQYHLTQLQLIEFAVASKFIQNITNKYLASAIETKVFSNYAIADNINLNYGVCFSYCYYSKLTHQTTNYFNDNSQLNNQFNIKAVVNLIIKQAFSCGITTDYSYSNISQTLAASLLLKYKFMLI